MICSVVVRRAAYGELEARLTLLRRGLASQHYDVFKFFLFQEVTLQASVLSGALLFIFAGASPAACALLVPATAALVGVAVLIAHQALAYEYAQRLSAERAGWVAELRDGDNDAAGPARLAPQVVGTASLSELWGPRDGGWLHLLAVDPRWRRRGVGRALVTAAVEYASATGLQSLEAVASQPQIAARALLLATGWRALECHHRRLVGAALTLPLLRLGIELPPRDSVPAAEQQPQLGGRHQHLPAAQSHFTINTLLTDRRRLTSPLFT